MNLHALANQSSPEKSPVRLDPRLSACFKVENVCQPGNTLLWDLLQDNKIVSLPINHYKHSVNVLIVRYRANLAKV